MEKCETSLQRLYWFHPNSREHQKTLRLEGVLEWARLRQAQFKCRLWGWRMQGWGSVYLQQWFWQMGHFPLVRFFLSLCIVIFTAGGVLVVTLFAPSAPQIEVSRAISLHILVFSRKLPTSTKAIQMYLFLTACNLCDFICPTFKDLFLDLMEFSNSLIDTIVKLCFPIILHTWTQSNPGCLSWQHIICIKGTIVQQR